MGSKKDIFLWAVLFAVFVASILVIYHFSRVKKEALGIKDELEIKASETTVVKRLSDNEIRKLQNKGEVVLCSAEGLIPDYTRGEFVIVNKDTNEVKAATSDWSDTEWIINFEGSSKGYLIALNVNYRPSENDTIYYCETDDAGDVIKWCECRQFTMGEEEKDKNKFPYEQQLKEYKEINK